MLNTTASSSGTLSQKIYGTVAVGPEDGNRNVQKAETPLREKRLRVGVLQSVEEKASGRLQQPEVLMRKMRTNILAQPLVIGQGQWF